MSFSSAIKKKIKQLIYPRRVCNICGYRFNGYFYPISAFYQENLSRHGFPYSFDEAETLNYKEYTCPSCQSSDRDRLYALFFDRNLQPQTPYTLLDIAPGNTLRTFLKKKPNISYRSSDLYRTDVDDTGVDITDMTLYADNSFDIFICSHVLEHVPNDSKAMSELYRILKPGGFGILMVPIVPKLAAIDEDITITDSAERWRRFGQDDHVRLYSRQGFLDRLTQTGFKIDLYTLSNFNRKEFILHGISPKSTLYIGRK